MEGFFQCLTRYRAVCRQCQAHGSAQLSTSSAEYLQLLTSLSKCLVKLRSKFGTLSASYGHRDTVAEDKARRYLNTHLPSALLQARGDAEDFVKLWRKVCKPYPICLFMYFCLSFVQHRMWLNSLFSLSLSLYVYI